MDAGSTDLIRMLSGGASGSTSVKRLPSPTVDSSSTREAGGTGLGLSIVRRLIDGHDGTVRITDNTPKGTVFVVTIPVKRATIG